DGTPPPPPPPPQNLAATPTSVSQISLTWDHPNPTGLRFEIQRARDGGPFEVLATVDDTSFVDPKSLPTLAPLERGATYNYQVFAFLPDNPDNKSDGSNISDPVRPLAFAADLSVPQQIPIPPPNYTFVLRISPARLFNSGTQIRLTLQGAPSGNVIINSIYV